MIMILFVKAVCLALLAARTKSTASLVFPIATSLGYRVVDCRHCVDEEA